MKKLLLLFAIVLAPIFLQAQTTIDRAMSVWARNIANANFTEAYTNIATNVTNIATNTTSIATLSDSVISELVKADSANFNDVAIDTLQVDSANINEAAIDTIVIDIATIDTISVRAIDADTIDIDILKFENGASIVNSEADTLFITETVTKITGELFITEHVTEGEHESGQTSLTTPGTQTIGTGGTFERLNEGNMAYTGSHLHEFSHDDGRLTYTRHTDISMTMIATVSVDSGETAQKIQLRFAKNGTTIEGTNMSVDFTAVNKNAAIPLFWMIDMSQNDYVEVWGTSDTNGDTFNVDHLTFGITTH